MTGMDLDKEIRWGKPQLTRLMLFGVTPCLTLTCVLDAEYTTYVWGGLAVDWAGWRRWSIGL